jgi:2-methylcitrate dehydratase PrpD
MLRLSEEAFADALGIAGSFTGGIWAFLADGADTKRFHPGKAAENGLTASLLAASGMSGPRRVLEADWGGFFTTYAHGLETPELTVLDLGVEFRIARSGMKPHACCRGLHFTIDALLELMRETGIGSRDVAELVVHGNAQTVRQFDRRELRTLLDAQFSMPYALAVAAESGRATLDQFAPMRTEEPEIRRLMAATVVLSDRQLAIGEYPPLEMRLRDGRRFERAVRHAKGAPENPLSDAELRAKAESLIGPVLGGARCRDIAEAIDELDALADCSDLMSLLAGEDDRRAAA